MKLKLISFAWKIKVILATLLIVPLLLFSQNNKQQQLRKNKINDILKEKLRFEENAKPIKTLRQQSSVLNQENETAVATSSVPESEVHAVINPTDTNNIVFCPIKLIKNDNTLSLKPEFPLYFTKDFGDSWNKSTSVLKPKDADSTIIGGGDPVLAFDADGKLYFSWIHLYYKKNHGDTVFWALNWAFSNDKGINWNFAKNEKLEFSKGFISPYFDFDEVADKQWMVCDKSSSAYKNNLYVAYLKVSTLNGINIVVKRKKADNNYFDSNSVVISSGSNLQFAGITVDNNGYVHLTYCSSMNSVWHSVSKDGGNTFTSPTKITDFIMPSSISGIYKDRLFPATQITSDNSNSTNENNLYLTFTAVGISSTKTSGADIYFCRSIDGGNSWSKPIVVNDTISQNPRDQFYSTIFVNQKGVVTACWYDSKYSPTKTENKAVNYCISHSFDGGLSFSPQSRISGTSTNFQTVRYKNYTFGVGEYNQVVASGSMAFPIWADGRKGNGDLDIYVAKIKISKTSEIQTITNVSSGIKLFKPFPNPAKNNVIIRYSLNYKANVKFAVFEKTGKIVKEIEKGNKNAGTYENNINISDFKNGEYFIVMITNFGYCTQRFSVVN